MKVVFDLDGVIRDLNQLLLERYNVPYPQTWYWSYKGKGVYDYVKDDYSILRDAPPTEYLDVVKQYTRYPEFWTNQPQDWLRHTYKWLQKYFDGYTLIMLGPEEKYDKLMRNKDIILVEDYPNFRDYSRIILVDRPYNRQVNAPMRVKNAEEFRKLLNFLKGGL